MCRLLGGLWTTAGEARAVKCVILLGDELIKRGRVGVAGRVTQGGEVSFIKYYNEDNLNVVAVKCVCENS